MVVYLFLSEPRLDGCSLDGQWCKIIVWPKCHCWIQMRKSAPYPVHYLTTERRRANHSVYIDCLPSVLIIILLLSLYYAFIFCTCGYFLSSFFFAYSPRSEIGCPPHKCHDVPLVWIYNACLKCAARGSLKLQDTKITQKINIHAPLHYFVRLYLCK